MEGRTLVLGGTGSFGGAMAEALIANGALVCLLTRNPGRAEKRFGRYAELEIIAGDVQDAAKLADAAKDCAVIVHGVNYPYDRWVPFMRTATQNVIKAAAGKTILFPGNVYGLGAQTSTALDESAGQLATTRKGKLRIHLEDMLREAAEQNDTRVLIVRAGDYFGPTARNGMVDRIFGHAAMGKKIQAFGRLDARHEWVYLPDLARASVALLEQTDKLAAFETVHVAGHVAESQRAFLARVAALAGHPELGMQILPWWLLGIYGLFDGVVRELLELRYLFDEAVILDGGKFAGLCPGFVRTPLDEAITTTLKSYKA